MGLAGCEGRREHTFSGRTMGTTYQVTVVTGRFGSVDGLQPKIDRRLDEVNRSMSPYIADSEISRFNRLAEVGREFPVSRDFLTVMKAAAEIHRLSEGAWDGTVNPLVDLWGFGRAGRIGTPPPAEKIAALLADIGFEKIEISGQWRTGQASGGRDPRPLLDRQGLRRRCRGGGGPRGRVRGVPGGDRRRGGGRRPARRRGALARRDQPAEGRGAAGRALPRGRARKLRLRHQRRLPPVLRRRTGCATRMSSTRAPAPP